MTVALPTPTTATMRASARAESPAYEARTPALSDRSVRAPVSLRPLGATLQDLATLEDDWDGYGALPPTRGALERVWYLASMLVEEGFPVPQAFPTRKGGLQLEWHAPHASLEWEFDPNGSTGLFIFDDHRTGATLDGELPGAKYRLVEALLRIQRG
jgi:hypothetical protein